MHRTYHIGMLLLLVGTAAGAAPVTVNVSSNSTRAEVLSSLGKPLGAIKQGQRELLIYKDKEIQLQNGCVLRVRLLNAALTENDADVPSAVAPASNQTAGTTAVSKPATGQAAAVAVATNGVSAHRPMGHAPFPTKLSEWRGRSISGTGWVLIALGAILGLVGAGGSVACGIWFLIEAFRVHVGWGLACLFLPFASLVFLFTHWEEGGKPFLISLGGSLAACGGLGVVMFGLGH